MHLLAVRPERLVQTLQEPQQEPQSQEQEQQQQEQQQQEQQPQALLREQAQPVLVLQRLNHLRHQQVQDVHPLELLYQLGHQLQEERQLLEKESLYQLCQSILQGALHLLQLNRQRS
jgi:hypothetical protein